MSELPPALDRLCPHGVSQAEPCGVCDEGGDCFAPISPEFAEMLDDIEHEEDPRE